jgi:hypothetical protein
VDFSAQRDAFWGPLQQPHCCANWESLILLHLCSWNGAVHIKEVNVLTHEQIQTKVCGHYWHLVDKQNAVHCEWVMHSPVKGLTIRGKSSNIIGLLQWDVTSEQHLEPFMQFLAFTRGVSAIIPRCLQQSMLHLRIWMRTRKWRTRTKQRDVPLEPTDAGEMIPRPRYNEFWIVWVRALIKDWLSGLEKESCLGYCSTYKI